MKVWPRNDDIRKFIKHPTGVGFADDGPAEWPEDSFTTRRIADGDVLTEQPVQKRASQKSD